MSTTRQWLLAVLLGGVLPFLCCASGLLWWLSGKRVGDLSITGPDLELRVTSVEETGIGLDAPWTTHTLLARRTMDVAWSTPFVVRTPLRVAPNPADCSFFGTSGLVVVIGDWIVTTPDAGRSWHSWSAYSVADGQRPQTWSVQSAAVSTDGSGSARARCGSRGSGYGGDSCEGRMEEAGCGIARGEPGQGFASIE